MVTRSIVLKHQNKEVKVTVEFPIQSDKVAEQEFIGRLKEMYLRKIGIEDRQGDNSSRSVSFAKRQSIESGREA